MTGPSVERNDEWFSDQCSRCDAKFYDDGRDSDAGWNYGDITSPAVDCLVCPDCLTPTEQVTNAKAFIAVVKGGQAIYADRGEEYPNPELIALAAEQQAWLDDVEPAVMAMGALAHRPKRKRNMTRANHMRRIMAGEEM